VSWRTATPARRAGYAVEAGRRGRRRPGPRDFGAYGGVEGRGRKRFTVRLRPRHPAAIRWVRVTGYSADRGDTPPAVTVPVR